MTLFERCRVLGLDGATIMRDGDLVRVDPGLISLQNLNQPSDYQRALHLPAPEIRVEGLPPGRLIRAWTLGDAAATLGLGLDGDVRLNGHRVVGDPELPLVAGDVIAVARHPLSPRTSG
jgi:hypothetical protein